jgi:hypothetical protein
MRVSCVRLLLLFAGSFTGRPASVVKPRSDPKTFFANERTFLQWLQICESRACLLSVFEDAGLLVLHAAAWCMLLIPDKAWQSFAGYLMTC